MVDHTMCDTVSSLSQLINCRVVKSTVPPLPHLTHRHCKLTWSVNIRPELKVADGVRGLSRQAVLLELSSVDICDNTLEMYSHSNCTCFIETHILIVQTLYTYPHSKCTYFIDVLTSSFGSTYFCVFHSPNSVSFIRVKGSTFRFRVRCECSKFFRAVMFV